MDLNKKNIKGLLIVICVSILVWWSLSHFEAFEWLLKKLMSILSPFLVGFAIAFIVNLVLRPLEELWDRLWKGKPLAEKLKRIVCLVLSFLFVLSIVFLVCFIILPQLGQTVSEIASALPGYLSDVETWWNELSLEVGDYVITLPQFQFSSEKLLEQLPSLWENVGKSVFDTTIGAATSIVSFVANLLLALVFSAYVLAQKETLGRQIRKILLAFLPQKKAEGIVAFSQRAGRTFGSFVTGQLTEAVILGSLCFVGMLILRMPYPALISVLVGVTALVPIFGAWIGAAVGALLILMVSPIQALWFLVFLICLQQFEGNVIYPHVVGKSVGLPGIWVFASVTVAAAAFGIVGMLLCVPISAIIYELLRELVHRRLEIREAQFAAEVPPQEAPPEK